MGVGVFGAVLLILFIVLVAAFVYAINVISMDGFADDGGYDVDGDGGVDGFADDDDIGVRAVNCDDR